MEPPQAACTQRVNDALPSSNKVNLAHFLLTANISSHTRTSQVTVLVDTRALFNFIDMRLARSLELDLASEGHVLGASSELIEFASSLNLLYIKASGHTFSEPLQAIPGLIYPLIVEAGWWRENALR